MKKNIAFIILITLIFLTACKGETNTTEEVPQTQLDSSETFQILKTKAMQTAWAQLTLAAVLQPTQTPQPQANQVEQESPATAYPAIEMPTQDIIDPIPEEILPSEESSLIPSLPPQESPTPTPTPTTQTGLATFTPMPENALYRCSAQLLSPIPAETLSIGSVFETQWQITNTGSAIWEKDSVDLTFVDGTKLHTSVDIFDMNMTVNPGDTITLTIPMRAPDQAGVFQTGWALRRGTLYYCPLNVSIDVGN